MLHSLSDFMHENSASAKDQGLLCRRVKSPKSYYVFPCTWFKVSSCCPWPKYWYIDSITVICHVLDSCFFLSVFEHTRSDLPLLMFRMRVMFSDFKVSGLTLFRVVDLEMLYRAREAATDQTNQNSLNKHLPSSEKTRVIKFWYGSVRIMKVSGWLLACLSEIGSKDLISSRLHIFTLLYRVAGTHSHPV